MIAPRHPVRPQHGFTLHEMIITLAMLAVILGLGVPTMENFITGQRVRTAAFDLTSTLLMARSEATKRNADVVVTPLGGGWHDGWTVTTVTPTGVETLMQHDPMAKIKLTTAVANITYRHTGRIVPLAVEAKFTVDAEPANPSVKQRCLLVDTSGKVTNEC